MLFEPLLEGLPIDVNALPDPDNALVEAVPVSVENPPTDRRFGKGGVLFGKLCDGQDILGVCWHSRLLHDRSPPIFDMVHVIVVLFDVDQKFTDQC
jgi:hypothetical protein